MIAGVIRSYFHSVETAATLDADWEPSQMAGKPDGMAKLAGGGAGRKGMQTTTTTTKRRQGVNWGASRVKGGGENRGVGGGRESGGEREMLWRKSEES